MWRYIDLPQGTVKDPLTDSLYTFSEGVFKDIITLEGAQTLSDLQGSITSETYITSYIITTGSSGNTGSTTLNNGLNNSKTTTNQSSNDEQQLASPTSGKRVRFVLQPAPDVVYIDDREDKTTSKHSSIIITGSENVYSIPSKIMSSSTTTKTATHRSPSRTSIPPLLNMSFVDAVNKKYLDLSTGRFSFLSSSSSYSPTIGDGSNRANSSGGGLKQKNYQENEYNFSSSSSHSPQQKSIHSLNNIDNDSSSFSNTTNREQQQTTITLSLKQAIDQQILNPHSAYIVDTLEKKNYNLDDAYQQGLIMASTTDTSHTHVIDRKNQSKPYELGDALKLGILKLGDASLSQSYNIISKTESLIISSVYDHKLATYIEPNQAIKTKILDPYHGLYHNTATNEAISIDDAMNKGFILVQPQVSSPSSASASSRHGSDKYVISTSLIRETRSYHLLGVIDHVNNKELTVQEAIRSGILDKQGGQYINKVTGEIFSISEAILHGHIRAQPLPVVNNDNVSIDGVHSSSGTQSTSSLHKRGAVKETKTYTLISAIHPRTKREIPIRQAIDEGIIDHAKGFYVDTIKNETLPISIAIEKGLIFTELIDQHGRRFIKSLIIEEVIDPLTKRRLGVNEAIQSGLLNPTVTTYYHPITKKHLTILEAYEQELIIGKFHDNVPSSFTTGNEHREQVFYLITGITDVRTHRTYTLQEGIQHKLFDHKKGVYIHPLTNEEINIGDAVKKGIIQVKAVSSEIAFMTDGTDKNRRAAYISQLPYTDSSTHDSRSKLSIRIESNARPRTPYEINEYETLQESGGRKENDVIEIASINRIPRNHAQRRTHHSTQEEIIEQYTTNITDRQVIIDRSQRSKSRERPKRIEEVVIDDTGRRGKTIDIKDDKYTLHREIVIDGDRRVPTVPKRPPPKDYLVINGSTKHDEREVIKLIPTPQRPIQPTQSVRPLTIDDREGESKRIHHGEIHIDEHYHNYQKKPSTITTTKEVIDITDHVPHKPIRPVTTTGRTETTTRTDAWLKSIENQQPSTIVDYDENQSWSEEEWEQWYCLMMVKGQPYRVVWVMNTLTGDRLPLSNALQRGLVDTKQRLFFDQKLGKSYTFEQAVELG
ncbi:unnamed protein product [Didymodactylos carnosus]|uniref:Uncharacterized protein n=1 Tax=Didymodactylos carnosus TaxID=1234261 RepID=A0A8S2CXJ5_9BILA|nr:unnamed protein product [Didymodactylos carnosus]CAF3568376.1 unnamed protein product [Didymodactylos carnosus]